MRGPSLLCILFSLVCYNGWTSAEWIYPVMEVDEGPFKGDEGEGTPKTIATIKSSDDNVATYSITGVGVGNKKDDGMIRFEMDSETGDFFLIAPLDRERKDSYSFTIYAYDNSGVSIEDGQDIYLKVKDKNDCKPVFDPNSLQGTVAEVPDSTMAFMTVKATDDDDPTTYNADVRYFMSNCTNPCPFTINAVSGQVSVRPDIQPGVLDYETKPVVKFEVLAKDNKGDDPSLKAIAEVTVKVTDSNDHAPEFEEEPYEKSLPETSKLNQPLYDIWASDIDEGINKKVYFDIYSGNEGGVFTMVSIPSETDRSKGQLQLVKPLDFESGNTKYTLTIRAYNKEAENSLDYSSLAYINVKVIDVNEPPAFINTPYTATVPEGQSVEEPVPINGLIVKAKDRDFGENQTVTYSVDQLEEWFQVNSKTGQVSMIAEVDREADYVENGVYLLKVLATDNYDNGPPATGDTYVEITITDVNDNAPTPNWSGDEDTVRICEKPVNDTVKLIVATDADSPENGPPFDFRFDNSKTAVDTNKWGFRKVDDVSQEVIAKFTDYGLSGGTEVVTLPFTITDSGTVSETGSATLTVSICKCNDDGEPACQDATAAGFHIAIIIAIIAILLLIMIVVFAVFAYKRKQAAMVLKEPFFDDEDDIRETVQVYQEEGGEEDQEAYDLSALRAPLMEDPNQPVRIEKPLQQAPRQPRGGVPDDIGDYIGEAKDQADADPSAPPFDSLLVFDYEGAGSDTGSLSSINTATTDGSMDYDYLNNWGPRFKKLADMYNDGSDSE